jgi:hypothetical protein
MDRLPADHYAQRKELPSKAKTLINRVTLNLGDANRVKHNLTDLIELEEVLIAHFNGRLPRLWRSWIGNYMTAAYSIANI